MRLLFAVVDGLILCAVLIVVFSLIALGLNVVHWLVDGKLGGWTIPLFIALFAGVIGAVYSWNQNAPPPSK